MDPINLNLSLAPPRSKDFYAQPRQVIVPAKEKEKPEEYVPGHDLENYKRRAPSADGTYVLVTTHTERIEMIPQPPTPEEVAERKAEREKQEAAQAKSDKRTAIVVGTLTTLFLSGLGFLMYKDLENQREIVAKKPVRKTKTVTS